MRELAYSTGLAAVCAATAVALWARAGEEFAPTQAPPVRYGRDVRPILSDRCFLCHGPDAATREAGLRLDVAHEATADLGGYAAIVPGNPEASELWARINHHNAGEVMPPPRSHKRALDDAEKELIRRWIEEGARYEPHWAFSPPSRPAPPDVRDEAWPRGEIDQFILAALEGAGLTPSPQAEKTTLLRRVFLDLTGLPPTPEEIEAFLTDSRPDAYERWVDRLLTEVPYRTRSAERLAVPWLDQARYADTSGIHMDAGRSIWPWRDWVLMALRDNMPFDRFIVEQIAGDLLPNATQNQKVASGFNRNHVTSDEGGAINEEYLLEYAVDRVSTVGSVMLGLSLGCARCHDHKFDPVTMEDFYGFTSFFNSIEEPGVYSQLPDAKRAFEPFMAAPTPEQEAEVRELEEAVRAVTAAMGEVSPREQRLQAHFAGHAARRAGVSWIESKPVAAESSGGSTLTIQDDGSVRVSGANPDDDEHTITVRVDGTGLRLILLEALGDASFPEGRVGRAPNGNAVLTAIRAEAVSVADPSRRREVPLAWAWADVEQFNGDFKVSNAVFGGGGDRGWAVDAHRTPGDRVALFLAAEPFGFEGGTDLRVRLEYKSIYKQHALGRVRLSAGTINDEGLARLPEWAGSWYLVGPIPGTPGEVYETAFGPEEDGRIDLERNFGFGNQYWRYAPDIADAKLVSFAGGTNAYYVGRRLYSPTARSLDLSLGSDDGIRVYVNGSEAYSNRIDRALAADQDRVTIGLVAGENTVVFKIVNTGGAAGFYHRVLGKEGLLAGDLVAAILPERALAGPRAERLATAWRLAFSPRYREFAADLASRQKSLSEAQARIPLTMVMKELPQRRETFVHTRGQYDHPDKSRPVQRAVPAALGQLPDDAPKDRLGLAQWLTGPENPLLARVTVNRLWEQFFGNGLVRTSEDFGLQGEWPSHPELLDWLAVEFRESGWDIRALVRWIVTSSTYRQASRLRPEAVERDPQNRLLANFPRQRLSAEQIRDQALYVSGLLVERLGGPSVKPYQPAGLWEEVAMPQSNTRVYEQGAGDELWRRSLYTYWKRAAPPPSMLAFDAPTREFCTIRRMTTSTPLQALVLWNDEQFVEASRALAARTLAEPGDDAARLARMYTRCTGRKADAARVSMLAETLAAYRERYASAAEDAAKLIEVGESMTPAEIDKGELAAWTMLGNALMCTDAAIVKN